MIETDKIMTDESPTNKVNVVNPGMTVAVDDKHKEAAGVAVNKDDRSSTDDCKYDTLELVKNAVAEEEVFDSNEPKSYDVDGELERLTTHSNKKTEEPVSDDKRKL